MLFFFGWGVDSSFAKCLAEEERSGCYSFIVACVCFWRCSTVSHEAVGQNAFFLNSGLQIRVRFGKSFLYFSSKTYVVGTQKNRLNETVLLSTQNTCLN